MPSTISGIRVTDSRKVRSFIDINDGTAKLQLYCNVKEPSESVRNLLEALDLGDFIGASGTVRRRRSRKRRATTGRASLVGLWTSLRLEAEGESIPR